MPKLHSINIQVEEVAVGYVLRTLHSMPGVAKVGYDMEGFAHTSNKPNGEYKPRASSRYKVRGHELVLDLLRKAGRPLRTSELRVAFSKAGRGSSVASAVHRGKSEGLIATTHDGYVLTKKAKDQLRRKEA